MANNGDIPRILLVDDDPATYWRIKAELDHQASLDGVHPAHLEFYHVASYLSAVDERGIALMATNDFRLVFIDLLLIDRVTVGDDPRDISDRLYGLRVVEAILERLREMDPAPIVHPCLCVLSAYAALPDVTNRLRAYDPRFLSLDEAIKRANSKAVIDRVIYADKSERTFETLLLLVTQGTKARYSKRYRPIDFKLW